MLAVWELRVPPAAEGGLRCCAANPPELERYSGNPGMTNRRERGFFGVAEVKLVGRLLEDLALRQKTAPSA